jgi:cellulose synthase (UDP-forming)
LPAPVNSEIPPHTTPAPALEPDTGLELDALLAEHSASAELWRREQATVVAPPRRQPRRRRSDRAESRSDGLVSALSARRRAVLVLTACLWLATAVFFWSWWLEPGHQTTIAGLLVNSAVLGLELIVLPLWFFFFVLRMRRPDPALDVPRLRTAMIVTKAPSEPWELVRATLEAMLAQDFPHPYDVWLADEQLTDEAIDWCALHGVHMSTREGVPEYHNPTWPRRTKCKEGNLAFFYDQWGYRDYDVVAQLDADHVPAPHYLRRMVAPFSNPRVGYVAAPSICDRNAAESWSARGRLYSEAVLHGASQAGSNGGCAPSCIGSHYAVRTEALREAGGLGPELAEDFSTTLILSAHGWEGVFAIDAEAHGDGPDTVADSVTQDFQWARSMMRVLLTVSPRYWKGLSLARKFKLGGCQLWYPLHTLVMTVMLALPVWAVVAHTPLARVDVGDFYLHFAPVGLVMLGAALWLRSSGLLRPADAPVISWEAILFQFVRWPWALIGCLHAVWGCLTGREDGFKVTPKGAGGERPLPIRVLMPYLLLSAGSILPALLVDNAGAASGYYFWALINGALYLLVTIAVVALHIVENRAHTGRRSMLRFAGARLPAIATLAVALGLAVVLHGPQAVAGVTASVPPRPVAEAYVPAWPAASSRRASVDVGVTTLPLATQAARPWTPGDLQTVNAFEHAAHKHASIVMWYSDWQEGPPSTGQLGAVAQRGSTPEITWEPWDSTKGLYSPQPRYQLRNIIDGKFDAYIRTWAQSLAKWGKPVRLRFAQEMNGNWYPWAESANGNHPGEFVRAWRHVHDIFAAEKATNVRWVWSPVSGAPREYFPGYRYVNIVGLTCLNGGTAAFKEGWRSFASICGNSIHQLHALAPKLPIEISEVASAERGGSKAAWIQGMFAFLDHHPEVKSVVWFNIRKQANWPIQSSRAAESTFAAGVRAARYK